MAAGTRVTWRNFWDNTHLWCVLLESTVDEDLHWNATKILRLQLLEVSSGLAGKQVLLHFSKVFVQQSLSNNFSSEISNRLYIGDCRQCRRGIVAGGQFGLSNVNNQSGIITQGENLELPMLCLRKAHKLIWWLYRGGCKRWPREANMVRIYFGPSWISNGRP